MHISVASLEEQIKTYVGVIPLFSLFQICACTAGFFTILHSVGHIINFYHVTTQPVERLMCLLPEVSFPPDEKPDITFWLFRTVAGTTGLLLYAVFCVIYVFAHPKVREKGYNCFWFTHQFYILLYALSLLHGLQRLTSAPSFWVFFVGPAIIYTFDKVTVTRFTKGAFEQAVLYFDWLMRTLVEFDWLQPVARYPIKFKIISASINCKANLFSSF